MSELPDPRRISCADATGTVYDHGAHVVDWIPTGRAPVLWLSPATALEAGEPIRGGVPICFPWFADGPSGDLEPRHGFARLLPWRVETLESSDHEAVVVHRLSDRDVTDPSHRELFPHPFEAQYEARFGAELVLSLTVSNTGDEAFEYEEALHAYLVVGDVRHVRVQGLDGARYRDKVLGRDGDVQAGDVRFDGQVDRVYSSTGEVSVVDERLGRVLRIRKEGSGNTVVWNPGAEVAARTPDVGDGWTGFVCVEAANAADRSVRLEPGDSHRLVYRVAVEQTAQDTVEPPA